MIGFRVDANEIVATGHMMRCIAIAKECMKRGNKCIFILAEDKETKIIKEYGFEYYILNSKWDDLEHEKEKMKELVFEKKLEWLIVDSYQANNKYLSFLNQYVKVLYIDDMVKEFYSVSALLHYSQWPDDNSYQHKYQGEKINLLAGMKFVPLREEFCDLEEGEERENNILITTGGTDRYDVTTQVLQSLYNKEEFKNYKFQVVVGRMNENRATLLDMQEKYGRISLYENVKNMGELMKKSKYAISAGGTTLYELCACKVPTVCFSVADNQENFTFEMGQHEVMLYAGDARKNPKIGEEIAKQLLFFAKGEKKENDYVNKMRELVDGKGTSRIVDFLTRFRE